MPETLRQIAGLTPPTTINPATTALILIDIQMDYFTADKLPIPDGPRVVENACRLRDHARKNDIFIVHVQQVSPNPAAPIFATGSPGVEIHPALAPAAVATAACSHEVVITKTQPSSFDRTTLDETLKARGIKTLILAGLMTHMCVETTARCALPLGYAVIVAADACASRDLCDPVGTTPIDHHEVHRNALAAMADRFADILTTDAITKLTVLTH